MREIYPRRDVRQGARAGALQQRRALAARARGGRADLPRDDERDLPQSSSEDRDEYEDIIADLDATLVDRYFCNFSLFQSLPDSWAIDQLFPIMPIHRLNEEPTRRGTLQDVTCDSDGKIDRFVGDKDGKPSLELHEFRDGEPYMLGVFLTGAYQEILGDLHNLFGDTNAVHIRLAGNGGYEITDLVHGDTVTEVLNYVQFRASDLLQTFRRKVTRRSTSAGRKRTRSSPTTSPGSRGTRTSRAKRRSRTGPPVLRSSGSYIPDGYVSGSSPPTRTGMWSASTPFDASTWMNAS